MKEKILVLTIDLIESEIQEHLNDNWHIKFRQLYTY